MPDDAQLLRLYAEKNSESAFAELVQRHVALVYSTALRQLNGDNHLAEDVAQSVFSALARKAASLSDHGSLAGWLYLGAHHAAAQIVRGEQRRRIREQEAHRMHELSHDTSDAGDWDRVGPVLDEAMSELAPPEREVVLLRYFEQRPFAEIGATLNLSEDAARMRVDRALEKLRGLLGRRGITSTAAVLVAAMGNQAMVAAPVGLAAAITGTALAATAATGSGLAATTVIFMNKTNVSFGIVALLGMSTAFYFASETRRAETSAVEAALERTALQARLASAEQRAVQAEQEAAAKRKVAEASEKSSPGGVATVAGQSNPATTQGFSFRFGSPPTDSEGVQQLREDALDSVYGALFRQLQFTPAQIEQFKTIKLQMLEKRNQLFGARIAAVAPENGRVAPADVKKIGEQLFQETDAEVAASFRSAFGEQLYAQFQHFEFTLPVRFLANELATALFNSAAPLETKQADQLVEILAKSARNARGKVDANALNGTTILAEAQSILTPVQLAAFSRIVSQQVKKQLDQERLLDSTKKTSAP